jgi:hypothetical protein
VLPCVYDVDKHSNMTFLCFSPGQSALRSYLIFSLGRRDVETASVVIDGLHVWGKMQRKIAVLVIRVVWKYQIWDSS